MSNKLKLSLIFTLGFFLGGASIALLFYYSVITNFNESDYRQAVFEARSTTQNLIILRNGNTESILNTLELKLDELIMSSTFYEKAQNKFKNDKDIIDAWKNINDYRTHHPSLHTNEKMIKTISDALKKNIHEKP